MRTPVTLGGYATLAELVIIAALISLGWNKPFKVQVARQFRDSAWGEGGINVKAVPRVVL